MLAVDLRNLTKRFGSVTAVMQNGGLLKDFTVAETVAYTASLYAHARPVHEVLERAGISAIGDRRVAKCSGGEQQRLRFAMFGGLFIPLSALSPTLRSVASFSPVWGVGQLARAPLLGNFSSAAVVSVVVWTLLFGMGAMALFRRDTARV